MMSTKVTSIMAIWQVTLSEVYQQTLEQDEQVSVYCIQCTLQTMDTVGTGLLEMLSLSRRLCLKVACTCIVSHTLYHEIKL